MLAKIMREMGDIMNNHARIQVCAAVIGLLLAAPLTAAQAQPSSAQQDAIRQSCRSDFMANCGGVQPGGKEALACLQHNLAKLSPACKTAVSATMAPAKTGHPPAAAAPATQPPAAGGSAPPHAPPKSAAAPPAAPPPPPSRTVAPLKLRPFIMPQRRLVIVGICGSDVSRLCQGVPPGGERVLKCLAAHASALTPQCYDAIARVSER